jgi:hypothetical protein
MTKSCSALNGLKYPPHGTLLEVLVMKEYDTMADNILPIIMGIKVQ